MDSPSTQAHPYHKLSADVVAQYVEALKDAYTRMRRRWRSDFRGVPSSHDNQLVYVATVLAERRANPYSYVRYVFDILTKKTPDVYINQLGSVSLADDFINNRALLEKDVQREVYGMADIVKTKLEQGFSLEQILTSPFFSLSPVFRYACAWSEGKHELAKTWEEDAKRMILFEPLYKELLGNWLPEEMKR